MFKRMFRSVFTRLAAILIVAVVGITGLYMMQVKGLQYGRVTSINRNFAEYAKLLVQKMGTPPSRAVAEEMGQRLKMRITLDGPQSWQAGRTDLTIPEDYLLWRFSTDEVQEFSLHGYYRIRVKISPQSTITFDMFPSEEERSALRRYGLISLLGCCLIMLLVYLSARHLLRPVIWLKQGAEAVRDGDLTYRVPEKSTGELRDLSETFNQMAARLEHLIESQQQLLLGVSHELRTPLTRLKLRLEMLNASQGDMSGKEAIQKDLRKMEDMITHLLDAARMKHKQGALDLQNGDLTALVEETATRYRDRAPGISLIIPSFPVRIPMDAERITVLLDNLVDNALKYSADSKEPVEFSLAEDGDQVIVTVKDHGKGIPAEAIPHLFEPFYRVDESRNRDTGGYGLGLHLCEAIVHAHNGTIAVSSELTRGTTMQVILPK